MSSWVHASPAAALAVPVLDGSWPPDGGPAEPLAGFVERRTGVRVEVHSPLERPDRWRAYLDGAEARYRAHGVLAALGRDELGDGRTTALVYVAVDGDDRVVAGIRCHGPLRRAADAAALRELAGHPMLDEVAGLLAARVGEGVVEVKGAWVDPGFPRAGLSDLLARCHVHAMAWFGARHAICTCSEQVAPRWASAGGRPLPGLDTVPYPDDRYRTTLLWWDRDHVEERCDPQQWADVVAEGRALGEPLRTPPAPVAGAAQGGPAWQAEVLDERVPVDAARIATLLAEPGVEVLDRLAAQQEGLRRIRPEVGAELEGEAPRWVHYPWRRSLVHLLGPAGFRALRLDRNRNKITREEQDRLAARRVGVVGLSVGHSIAYVLALEGICGTLRLADFDDIELSNLNRIPATVLDLGLNKAVVLGRRIAELDPYLTVELAPAGLTSAEVDRFVADLDVVVEECDSLDLKVAVREAARRCRVPVLMETSDRGLFDVERFDLEAGRPLFHGLLGDVDSASLVGLSTHDKVPHVLRLLEPDQLSSRMAASMAEIDETLTTWPQLGGDVQLGAATVAAAVRRLGRGDHLPSGRVRVDLESVLDGLAEPAAPSHPHVVAATAALPPQDAPMAVAHAANLAPSGGNVQPWSLHLEADRLRIFLDRSRTSTMDVRHRGSYVAIGAAVHNARVAAAAHGILGPVTYLPDGDGSDLVAELALGSGADAELAAGYAGVLARATNRRAGAPAPIAPGTAAALRDAAAAAGARLHLITSVDGIEDYAELLGESDRLRHLSPVLHREMMGELRWPGRDPIDTGIDVRTLELDEADLAKLAVARRADVMSALASWDGGRALGSVTRDRVRSCSGIAVVTIPEATPGGYVAGGAAVQRVWLAANASGLAVQPVSPISVFAVDAGDFEALVPQPYVQRLQGLAGRLRRVAELGDGEVVALVLRLGHVDGAGARSQRIPLEAALLDAGRAAPNRSGR